MATHVSLRNTTAAPTPRLPFRDLTETVLGPDYDLSVALVGNRRMRRLNREWLGKDRPTNVLAFPLDDTAGEIVLGVHVVRRQAPAFGRTYRTGMAYFFVHGLLHLKGYAHGGRMEEQERHVLELYKL